MSIDKIIATIPGKAETERRQMRANAERILAMGASAQKTDAQRLVDALDAAAISEREERNSRLKATPMANRIAEAFRNQPPTPKEVTVIQALLDNPGSTSIALTRACGWRAQSWHMHFGTMAKNREADLWPADPAVTRDSKFYSGILATFDEDERTFTMRPEVIDGFMKIGLSGASKGKG